MNRWEETNRALERPREVWSVDIGPYSLRGWYRQEPPGTFTICVTENDLELHRSVIQRGDVSEWRDAWRATADLRLQFQDRVGPGVRRLPPRPSRATSTQLGSERAGSERAGLQRPDSELAESERGESEQSKTERCDSEE